MTAFISVASLGLSTWAVWTLYTTPYTTTTAAATGVSLTAPPFFHACSGRSQRNRMSIRSQRIIYTKLMYSSTNIAGAELVPSNGTFICAYPGSYTVTWSLQTDVGDVEKGVELYLRKNNEQAGAELCQAQTKLGYSARQAKFG